MPDHAMSTFPTLQKPATVCPMLGVYLFALVVGLGVQSLQFILPGGSDGAANADTDVVGDVVSDVGSDIGGDVGGDVHAAVDGLDAPGGGAESGVSHGADGAGSHHGFSAGGILLSMRFWTFALMAFGMVGTPLHLLGRTSFVVTLAMAIGIGVASGLAAVSVFRALKKTVSSAAGVQDMVGKIAKVTLSVNKGSLGKVRLEVKGKQVDILAVTDIESIREGSDVVVVEFRDGHAYVEPIEKICE